MKGKLLILIVFSVFVLMAHVAAAAPSETTKTAYTAVQMYGFVNTGDEKIATIVAANYLHALTLTVTISSPRMLTYIDPYYTTLQPTETTIFYSPSNGKYYVNAIESDGTVIFFTDHEIYWRWNTRNNTVTMTVEKTLPIDNETVIIGKYDSWGTPVTLSIAYSYAPTTGSVSSSGTTVYFSTKIIDSTAIVFVASAFVSPTLVIFQPAPSLIAPNAVVKSISVSKGTAVFAVSFFGWGARKLTHITFTSIGWSASNVTEGPITFILTSKVGKYDLVTFWPSGFIVDGTSYNLIYFTTFGFIREEQASLTASGYMLGKYTTFVLSNGPDRVATYNNSLLVVVVSGKTPYSGKPYNYVPGGTVYVTSMWEYTTQVVPVTFYAYKKSTVLIVNGASFTINENNVLVGLFETNILPRTITITDKCGGGWPTYITIHYSIVGDHDGRTYKFFTLTIRKRYTNYYVTKIKAPKSYWILGYNYSAFEAGDGDAFYLAVKNYSAFEAGDGNSFYLAVIITIYITPKNTVSTWSIIQSGLASIDPIRYYVLGETFMLPRYSMFIRTNSLWINTYAVKNQKRLQNCIIKSRLILFIKMGIAVFLSFVLSYFVKDKAVWIILSVITAVLIMLL